LALLTGSQSQTTLGVKQITDRVGISERMSDYITGHAHRIIGAKYGAPTVEHMAAALEKLPRYEV
jgi:hypothetical protein